LKSNFLIVKLISRAHRVATDLRQVRGEKEGTAPTAVENLETVNNDAAINY
jgi:hypothetical protein